MTYGTSYFRSVVHAEMYYRAQYGAAARTAVAEKLNRGEIHIGMPPRKNGETCFLIDDGTRWAIDTGR